MQRVARLALFAVVVIAVVLGAAWTFRDHLLSAMGVSLDRGLAGETALALPDGYGSTVFAAGLRAPRFMAFSDGGSLFVAEMGADRVLALADDDGDGRADRTVVVGEGYGTAHSLAFTGPGSLLVAGTGTLYEVQLDDALRETSRRAVMSYPAGGNHSTRTIVVAPDGSLLLSVGSSCDACWESDERRAAILTSAADGSGQRVLMRGLRNAVGVAIDPASGVPWATTHGRDRMGDDFPPETLYRVIDGADAGWPRCHAGTIPDPALGQETDPTTGLTGCEGVVQPEATFQAHAAPLGLAFWDGRAVLAFHGSWNRSSKVGYEVLWMPWDDGPTGPSEVLVGGFLDATTGDSTGRPAGITVGPDGALYLSDDKGGFIYRITPPD
jgi:glucose/arabinose dehydrogenase